MAGKHLVICLRLDQTMGQLSHTLDEKNGVIRITGEGVYTVPQATEHFARLARTVAHVRAQRGQVRILINTSRGAVQPANVVAEIARGTEDLYRTQDRVALVVASILQSSNA